MLSNRYTVLMTPRASQGVATAFSRSVADSISHLIGMSGMSVTQVIEDAEMSRNYYYKRARYELPFNTNDISKIAQALDISPDLIVKTALTDLNRENNLIVGSFGQNAPIEEQAVAYTDDGDTGEDLQE